MPKFCFYYDMRCVLALVGWFDYVEKWVTQIIHALFWLLDPGWYYAGIKADCANGVVYG